MYRLSPSVARTEQKVLLPENDASGPPLYGTNLGRSISFLELIFLSLCISRALHILNLLRHHGEE